VDEVVVVVVVVVVVAAFRLDVCNACCNKTGASCSTNLVHRCRVNLGPVRYGRPPPPVAPLLLMINVCPRSIRKERKRRERERKEKILDCESLWMKLWLLLWLLLFCE